MSEPVKIAEDLREFARQIVVKVSRDTAAILHARNDLASADEPIEESDFCDEAEALATGAECGCLEPDEAVEASLMVWVERLMSEQLSAAEAELALAKEEIAALEAEGGKVASLRENHPFGSIYDALRKTEAERDKFNASNERLNADHARIVAEKDAEIERLREALETLAAPLDDKKRPYEGWWPVRVLARKWGIYEEDVQDAMDLIPLVARAALNPPQQKGSSDEE